MSKKAYYATVSSIFLVVGLAHLVRVALGWEIIIAEAMVAPWMSVVAGVLAIYLSARGFQFAGRKSSPIRQTGSWKSDRKASLRI